MVSHVAAFHALDAAAGAVLVEVYAIVTVKPVGSTAAPAESAVIAPERIVSVDVARKTSTGILPTDHLD